MNEAQPQLQLFLLNNQYCKELEAIEMLTQGKVPPSWKDD